MAHTDAFAIIVKGTLIRGEMTIDRFENSFQCIESFLMFICPMVHREPEESR